MKTEGFIRRLIIFIQGCYGFTQVPVNPVSHPHQIMHTHALKKKKEKTYKCKMFISFWRILNNLFSVSWKEGGTILKCIVLTSGSELWQKTSVQHDSQTTWMPTRWEIISCEEYGTWYHLFIRPTIEPLVNDGSQIEVMKHSRLLILYYTDSSAICVSLSLS